MQAAGRSHLPVGIWDLAFPGPDAQRLEKLSAMTVTRALHFAHYSRFLVATVLLRRGGRRLAIVDLHPRAA